MKTDGFLKALEDEATEQLTLIRAWRVYQGENPDYKNRAKMAIGVIGAYVRLRATLANERTNDLVAHRLMGTPPSPTALPEPAPLPKQ